MVMWPTLVLLLWYWGHSGQEYKRKNQGLLTTRSPCATTLHPIKEVKVLLPSVWFTREKERKKVGMLLRYFERHGGEHGGDDKTWWCCEGFLPNSVLSLSLHWCGTRQPWSEEKMDRRVSLTKRLRTLLHSCSCGGISYSGQNRMLNFVWKEKRLYSTNKVKFGHN